MSRDERCRSEDLLEESLVYERAWSKITTVLNNLRSEKERENEERRKRKEQPDKAWWVTLKAIESVQDEMRDYSDKLYEESRKCRVPFDPGYQMLLNAIVQKAAEDYEYALSGDRNEDEMEKLEEFADILGLRARNIFAKLRKNQAVFSEVARKNADAIIEETARNRKRGVAMENNKHKCPNCGGSLYTTRDYGSDRICCTKCYFFEAVKK